jgi:phosphatidylglycerophosphate synthase
MLVAVASAVLDDAAIAWLADHQGTVLASRGGRPLAVAVAPHERDRAVGSLRGLSNSFAVAHPQGDVFVRKLRRRVPLGAFSLEEEPARRVERHLFDGVYKGVTDVVTKWAWPGPAFVVTRACARLGITPNMVTWFGVLLVFVAGFLFYKSALVPGMIAAWLMTFLDTVDGKLARVTGKSSAFGNFLDHGTDVLHPPVWWYCLAQGVAIDNPHLAELIWPSLWIILGCYAVGRAIEIVFHKTFGFNPYIWRPFDSTFRLIISRRNIILLIMTAGLFVSEAEDTFFLCAAWSIVSTLIQLVRLVQAFAESRERRVTSWLV